MMVGGCGRRRGRRRRRRRRGCRGRRRRRAAPRRRRRRLPFGSKEAIGAQEQIGKAEKALGVRVRC